MLPDKEQLNRWVADHFENMSSNTLAHMVGLGADAAMDRLLGEQQVGAIRELLRTPPGDTYSTATVLIPGVMGSLLSSVRGAVGLLWFNTSVVMNGKLNLLDLNADGTDDLSPEVEIVPTGLEKTYYLRTILTLAHDTRLFEFPYDWRRQLEYNAQILRRCLLRWSQEVPGRKFVLVGHSMGGMLARTYLALYPEEAERLIDKVVLLGSPIYGAALAANALVGDERRMQMVDRLHPDNDAQRLVRNAPACYQLLPPPPEMFPAGVPYPFNWDAYDARAWGLPLRQDYLDAAKRWHQLVLGSDPQVAMWQIAGCHRSTVTHVMQSPPPAGKHGPPSFGQISHHEGPESGDQQVPLWSATSPLVRMLYVVEAHRSLATNSSVLADVLRLVRGEAPQLPKNLPEPPSPHATPKPGQLVQEARALRTRYLQGTLTVDDLRKMFFAG